MLTDDLGVPEFLKRTPEQQKRIDEWNATHPPTSCSFVDPKVEENITRRKAELKEASRVASLKSKMRKETRSVLEAVKEESQGKEWRNGRWTTPGLISRADADRILRELPTERHRKIFIQKYSSRVKGKAA